eukprot:TRINITY_DN68586_c0_g1_i1.p1 TRINITY_DN68586_c0_g1~~TRINITY_DN68586_c0_g1_i1.p1  ORF type:complete len:930 (-),score=237.68 TRINITY_DN68586_c0_g1_i1:87-2876(-)
MSWQGGQNSSVGGIKLVNGSIRTDWIPASRQPSTAPTTGGVASDVHTPSAVPVRIATISNGACAAPHRPSTSGPGVGDGHSPLTCTGCNNPTVSSIIKGIYTENGSNHGKPVYKKDGDAKVSIMIYFWDDRDGPNFSGWWFGPKLGGDQVWAYNGDVSSRVPPVAGWKVPWDGPEDTMLQLTRGSAPGVGKQGVSVAPPLRQLQRLPPQQLQQRQQQQEELRRREEEKREEKRRDDERRQREDEARKRQKEREEEARRKREEEDQRRKEAAAVLAVRKIIQRVRIAQPETYDALRTELEEAQAEHLEAMGAQAESVSQEAEKAMQQAQQRIDEINEKRADDERRAAEEEKRLKEETEKVDRLMKEIKEELAAFEKHIKAAEDSERTVSETADAKPEVVLAAVDAAEKVIQEARENLEATAKSLAEKRDEMGDGEAAQSVGRDVAEATDALASGRRVLARLTSSVKSVGEREARRCAALKKLAERREEFNKFDRDNDGALNRTEVVDFSNAVYAFELPQQTLDKIVKFMSPIGIEKFQRMRGMVAIARSEAAARAKRAAEEERKREEEEKRKAMQGVFDEIAELLSAAEAHVTTAEANGMPLARGGELDAEEMKKAAASVEDAATKAEKELERAMSKLTEAESACAAEDALKSFETRDIPRLRQRHAKGQGRTEKATALAKQATERAVRKAYAEIEQRRAEVVTAIRIFMSAESKSGQDVFMVASGDEETLSRANFVSFVDRVGGSLKLDEDQVNKLFDNISCSAAQISKHQFMELIRLFYKCVKSTVLSETISIKSKTIRRLDLAEVVEAIEGPCKDEGAGVERVRCRAVNDDAEGWVTIAGNQGTSFLEPGGNLYAVLKETVLSDGLSVQDSKTLRRVSKGEVIEVVEFAKKDESLGVKRVRGKCKIDGATGWITMSGNQGTCFLEQC